MRNRFDLDDDRYATDKGPSCPKCKQADHDTMWVYLCQWPCHTVLAQSLCCHEFDQFELTTEERHGMELAPSSDGRPDINTIKAAHYRHRATPRAPLQDRIADQSSCCEISWIDDNGAPTPDTNDAIGHVYREDHYWNGFHFPHTQYFRICEVHKARLANLPHWRFVPIVVAKAA